MPTENIGTRLLRVREAAGLTQEQLGRKIGITSSSISRIEAGKRNPRPTTVIAIASVLGIDPAELTGDVAA